MKQITTIIQSSEAADYAKLPQIENLCHNLKERVKSTKDNTAQAEVQAMMIAREIYEYAARPEVIATIETINAAKKLLPDYRGGSPIKAHRYAMNAVADKCGVTPRTLNNWMRRWAEVSKYLDLKIDCEQSAFMKHIEGIGDLHLWMENLTPEPEAPKDPVTMSPEKIATMLGNAFLKAFMDKNGRARCDKKAQVAVLREFNPLARKVGFELVPVGSE